MNKNKELDFLLKNNNLTIYLLELLHNLKFFNVSEEVQERKVYAEMAEFQSCTTKDEKIEEAVDCIFALIGYITKTGSDVSEEIRKKISKVLLREYPDNFQHKEEV